MSNDLFKRNCAVLAQWYAGECEGVLQFNHDGVWEEANGCSPHVCEYRIKPRTITVNGIEVPEPVRTMPSFGDRIFLADVCKVDGVTDWGFDASPQLMAAFRRGIIHLTKEAAQQHAEAMLAPSKRAES